MFALALTYLLTWIIVLNSAFLAPKPLTLLPQWFGDTLPWRVLEGLWRLPLLLALGYFVDRQTYLQPHGAWQTWEFYATWLSLSALLVLPGLLLYLRGRGDVVRHNAL